MKKLIKIAPPAMLLLSAVLFALSFVLNVSGASGEAMTTRDDAYTCPTGSYPIGNGVCKKEPSGCPFYENVDAKGCVPPPNIKCSDDTYANCWSVDTQTETPAKPTTPPVTTPTPTVPTCQEVK